MEGGLWPYEKNRTTKSFSRLFVGTYIVVPTLPQFYGLYKNFGVHMEKIIEHMALLMFMDDIFLKFVTSVMVLAYMLMAMVFYMMLPLTPLLLNIVAPLNETRLLEFIFKGEFPVDDMLDHYIEIFVFDTLGCLSTIYVLVSVDGMYASCIEHCSGIFDIIKRRLKLCTNHADVHGEAVAYKLIVEVVKLHVKIIA